MPACAAWALQHGSACCSEPQPPQRPENTGQFRESKPTGTEAARPPPVYDCPSVGWPGFRSLRPPGARASESPAIAGPGAPFGLRALERGSGRMVRVAGQAERAGAAAPGFKFAGRPRARTPRVAFQRPIVRSTGLPFGVV
jgi:hypothetical protein